MLGTNFCSEVSLSIVSIGVVNDLLLHFGYKALEIVVWCGVVGEWAPMLALEESDGEEKVGEGVKKMA